ncbi:MAG: HipA N-terminal domain-containing protein [Campylobacterota bacterium]|nr:HipA N-terminal domain-containing protein [Campylobacterota bacterium]
MQKGIVYRNQVAIGMIVKENGIYRFVYDQAYLKDPDAVPISVCFPLEDEMFESNQLFSFFANMLAEGNIKAIQCRDLQIDEDDHFTRLLKTARSNTIGAITIEELEEGS